ncbi:MAG TPA: ATP F0F1 synthase subunit B [Beijerinckiaceae bacterium]|nr:ATP F0F1 synthase subunit B [Beijerinckiaceae bacterium]
MFFEAEFWVAVSFFIFAAIVWKVGGLRARTEGLDKRGKRIQAELDEAKRLREEAAQVLADYKKRRGEAEREAEEIIAAAKEEAHRTAGEAHQRMEDFVKRRTAAAETKIAQAEAEATAQVRAAAADAAIQVSETILRERMAGEAAQELISRSLADVRTKLNS